MTAVKKYPAELYAEQVRSGEILVCEYVRLAVERYYADLDNPKNYYGMVFLARLQEIPTVFPYFQPLQEHQRLSFFDYLQHHFCLPPLSFIEL